MMHRPFLFTLFLAPLQFCICLLVLLPPAFSKKRSNKKRARQRQLLTSCCVDQACKQEVGDVNDAPAFSFHLVSSPSAVLHLAAAAVPSVFKKKKQQKECKAAAASHQLLRCSGVQTRGG